MGESLRGDQGLARGRFLRLIYSRAARSGSGMADNQKVRCPWDVETLSGEKNCGVQKGRDMELGGVAPNWE